MGSTTKTATEKNGVWTFGGLDLGTWTITSTKGGDSATQDVAITRLTVEYVTNRSCSGGERMTSEERKQRILAKIAEMKAEGADMQNALTILEVKPDEVE